MSRRSNLIVSCYIKDEGGPLGVAIQVEASNHLKVLLSKAMVLSVKEKAKQNACQIYVMEMNESEPLKTLRNAQLLSKPGLVWLPWDKPRGNLFTD